MRDGTPAAPRLPAVIETLKSSSVETVKLPARSPNLNAYAKRFVRSIKAECLAQIMQHLRHAVWTPLSNVVKDWAESSTTTKGGPLRRSAEFWHTTGAAPLNEQYGE
jgi:hypothetical protein